MSALLEIQKEIGHASGRVAELESALIQYPQYHSIAANLETEAKLLRQLHSQFDEIAARAGVEVCRYRAFDDKDAAIAGPAFAAIAGFQKLFSVVFRALKHGARQRATVTADIFDETAFRLGFAFQGSVGVVLTLPSDVDLFGSRIEDSLAAIGEMAVMDSASDVRRFADTLGPGAINALYQWAQSNAQYGLGADIEWRRGDTIRGKVFVQRQELSALRTAIEKTGSPHQDTVTIVGKLAAADSHAGRFKLTREGLSIIRGTVEPGAIDKKHEATVPRTYEARILRTRRLRFAKGTEEVKYHLLSLSPAKG